jgi:hypothetical protein
METFAALALLLALGIVAFSLLAIILTPVAVGAWLLDRVAGGKPRAVERPGEPPKGHRAALRPNDPLDPWVEIVNSAGETLFQGELLRADTVKEAARSSFVFPLKGELSPGAISPLATERLDREYPAFRTMPGRFLVLALTDPSFDVMMTTLTDAAKLRELSGKLAPLDRAGAPRVTINSNAIAIIDTADRAKFDEMWAEAMGPAGGPPPSA